MAEFHFGFRPAGLRPHRELRGQGPLALGGVCARGVPRPHGGGTGGGPFHSQNIEGHFLGTPGLKVVAPGTVGDAYALMRAAIEDPDSVLVLEHKALYRRLKDRWVEAPAARIGEAALRGWRFRA